MTRGLLILSRDHVGELILNKAFVVRKDLEAEAAERWIAQGAVLVIVVRKPIPVKEVIEALAEKKNLIDEYNEFIIALYRNSQDTSLDSWFMTHEEIKELT